MKAISKDYWREIKNTKSRFISIMVLVALAVAFLAGLRSTAPDMKRTGHDYIEEQQLADIQILSTLGLTDEDITEIAKRPEIKKVEGVYVIDAFCVSSTTDLVSKIYSIPESGISEIILKEGRMPQADDECVVEEMALADLNIALGDSVSILTSADMSDALKYEKYKVVGTVRSPIYISVERGSSTIGTGSVKIYLYLPKESFALDYYTAAFARLNGTDGMTAFYPEYDNYVDSVIDGLEEFALERSEKRYNQVKDDAASSIDDAQKKIDDARTLLDEALEKLTDSRKLLDEGLIEYADGKAQLEDAYDVLKKAEKEYNKGLSEYEIGLAEFEEKKLLYEDGLKKYNDGLLEYQKGKQEYDQGVLEFNEAKKKYEDGLREFEKGKAEYESGLKQYNKGKALFDTQLAEYNKACEDLENSKKELEANLGKLNSIGLPDSIKSIIQAQIDKIIAQIADGEKQLAAAKEQIDSGALSLAEAKKELDEGLEELKVYEKQIADGKAELDKGEAEILKYASDIADAEKELKSAKAILDDGKLQIDEGEKKLSAAKFELDDAKTEIERGWQEYNDGLAKLLESKAQLEDGEKEYQSGYSQYTDEKKDADEEIEEGQRKIDDAKEELAKLESCKWYIFARGYNPGYTGLGQDADRMGNLSNVFPIIFFLVAALVCLTTMTRMVEEQRIQIGGMKALGYARLAISAKYVGYGLIPSIIGSLIGLVIGYSLFPTMIFTAYQIMYQMPNIKIYWYSETSAMCIIAAVLCTTLSSLWACLATLKETPANLMRPKTPTAGKRVFLEYIVPLWSRMKFIHKVTARNLFRYKKRLIMTVVGIAGCTALMIAGFGLRSSLTHTMYRQYDDLFHYNAQVSLADDASEEELSAVRDFIDNDNRISGYMPARMLSYNAISDKNTQTAYLYVVDADELPDYIDIYSFKTGERMSLSDDGIYIDQKLSELLDVGIGDEILLDCDTRVYAKVAGIFEHYTGHFTYMSPAYYEDLFDKEYAINGYFMQFTSDEAEFCDGIFEDFMSLDGILGTARLLDIKDTYLHSMERIDFVVVIIILCSGALALVVLYNLSNINISERKRELATIKVLGFFDNEVSAYVYRENVVLTVFGILLGTLLGHWLHTWLVKAVEIDLMMFGRETDPKAYLWSALLTIVFAFIANLMAHFKMKKIDMVESLKSAE